MRISVRACVRYVLGVGSVRVEARVSVCVRVRLGLGFGVLEL